jgi:hypothetical protein
MTPPRSVVGALEDWKKLPLESQVDALKDWAVGVDDYLADNSEFLRKQKSYIQRHFDSFTKMHDTNLTIAKLDGESHKKASKRDGWLAVAIGVLTLSQVLHSILAH